MNNNINQNTIFKFGQKIRIERLKRKLSQEKFAELSNLNRNFIGMIERGETNVTIKNIEAMANAFGMKILDLFEFSI